MDQSKQPSVLLCFTNRLQMELSELFGDVCGLPCAFFCAFDVCRALFIYLTRAKKWCLCVRANRASRARVVHFEFRFSFEIFWKMKDEL